MEIKELFRIITERFVSLPKVAETLDDNVIIRAKTLSPEEAIGVTVRKDYPILMGKDRMIEADYKGTKGQAFTDAPSDWDGTIRELLKLDFENDPHARGLLIAAINAVMCYHGLCDRTVHCKNEIPEKCGLEIAKRIATDYQDPKTLIIGCQPAMIDSLSQTLSHLRVLDLNPDNIGQEKSGVIIENGADEQIMANAKEWAELILCTGSTVSNGTLVDYLDTGKETLFYGTTLAGTAALLNLKRICFANLKSR